ncbi:MAG: DUF642 domain-containing protein [Gammaproteobacteria bacterium]|nr:DUF642 domain-containing protein [Gammaproteobacteria bacterium]MBU1555934.1 DUF642 domain-containing protein [Gammaproteobacteria bacterium]MBU2070818.1 DUF642 domain-containing protein [Gammaproteobacteria bacterium]MBU2182809.1 DUF642 domain-containing protein [Gammaproteobacteria bacterium]MBU2205949.1 DUF642 domain-containing protein [Gammaproteobacteria bacterium]
MSVMSLRSAVCACTLLVASFASHAGLIVNGDFESHTLNKNSWTWLSSSQFDGWQGSNIEIWHALQGVEAVSGNHFIELNADGGNSGDWSIFQSFATEIGQHYQLDFYYRARTGNNEQFQVSVADIDWLLNDHSSAGWTQFSNSFIATGNSTTLRFTSKNPGTYGNFIDAVQVSAVPVISQVPEPATLAAFGLGLIGLLAGRRLRQPK